MDAFHIAGSAVMPFVALTSLSVFLSTHPASPAYALFHRRKRVALPTHANEALDGADGAGLGPVRDPFDVVNPAAEHDGDPIGAETFWRGQYRQKLALLALLVPPFAANVALLVLTTLATAGSTPDDRARAIIVPVLLVPAHLVVVILGVSALAHASTDRHWPSTLHLATTLGTQFVMLTMLAILPKVPLPSEPAFHIDAMFDRTGSFALPTGLVNILTAILPILHIPPLLVATVGLRRGPPLHLPIEAIYPPKITEAVPASHPARDPSVPNVIRETDVNVVESIYYGYCTEVVYRAHERDTMDVCDLPILRKEQRALPQFIAFRRAYGRNRRRLGRSEGFNLLWKLAKVNAKWLSIMIVASMFTAALYFLPHYVLKIFITYLENDPGRTAAGWGWFLALGLFLSNALVSVMANFIWSVNTTYLQGVMKLQLNTMLFTKTLLKKDVAAAGDVSNAVGGVKEEAEKAKNGEKKDEDEEEAVASKSQIMTLFTVDVDRVTEFNFHVFTVIDTPIELVVGTLLLINLLGVSAIFGLLTIILCIPLNHFASKVVVTTQDNLMKTRDQRTALMNEILQGIRMLKFMAWERSFEARIDTIRRAELSWQARNYQIEVAFGCIWALTPVLVTVVSFLHYTLIAGHRLTPSVAFTSIAVFAELRFAFNALPETFISALQGFVSCRRIEKYLSLAEVSAIEPVREPQDIVLSSVTFTWPCDDSNDAKLLKSGAPTPKAAFTLADLSLRFPKGQLSLICGRLGSGKSLLLAGLLGEADLVAGALTCPRSAPDTISNFAATISADEWLLPEMVGYVPQQAWLQNASIKENIIFSSPFDAVRYAAVIEACSLTTDLRILEDGDETEIGEKGLNLSGGQKARVSLARAVYSRAATLFLDDVLSAVDAHTAHAIMQNCLQGPLMDGRTVLLVSHHTALVSPAAAYIVALENGDVKFSGTRADFVACGFMNELDQEDAQARRTEGEAKEERTIEESTKTKPAHKSVTHLVHAAAASSASEPNSETSSLAPTDEDATLAASEASQADSVAKQKAPRKLIEDEKRARGRIAWPVWKTYFTALGGPFWWSCFIFALLVAMIQPIAEKGWLQYWTGSELAATSTEHSATYYMTGYTMIAVSGVFLQNLQYAAIYWGSIHASKLLHARMLESVLFATLRFHDTTSRGRLLNRFGKDIEGLDASMADNFVRSLSYGLDALVTFVTIAYVGGWPFIAAGAVVMLLYYRVGSVYGQTSRDMRRLDSVTRSPLYSLFGESVSGVAVLRAFGASTIALNHMMRLADTNMLAFVWSWNVNRWLSARFNLFSAGIVGCTAGAVLIAPGTTAAMAGFALSFASGVSHSILFVCRRAVQLEQSMVALERIKEYSELQQEAAEFVEPRPPASWPHEGAIDVQNLVIRYAPDLPNVLHGLSFSVKPREKIGIVGSTGCGKSTLALSFFRFVEATEGRIVIDGIDIAKIGLTDLRNRITIIPQDPTILSGTLRNTLDVFDEYDDADIYASLRRVHLLKDDDAVGSAAAAADADAEGGGERNKNVFRDLSNPVSEGGDNFSSGEKQLICMARAILRRNRVLFMDEATASIDYETDELISTTIRDEFRDSTILTIAHRIHTIIDFDRVLVMDQGRIAEFASPAELLRDHKSRFYALCKATGRSEFKNLKEMALEAERKRKVQA
ncbi:hypothetical protein Q5752_000834 [Cryptotrichosporon argae]